MRDYTPPNPSLTPPPKVTGYEDKPRPEPHVPSETEWQDMGRPAVEDEDDGA